MSHVDPMKGLVCRDLTTPAMRKVRATRVAFNTLEGWKAYDEAMAIPERRIRWLQEDAHIEALLYGRALSVIPREPT